MQSSPWVAKNPGRLLRTDWLLLGIILFIALAVRIVYFLVVRDQLYFTNPIIDSFNFHNWAAEIAQGRLLGTEVFTQSPFYAYFLGLIYAIAGPKTLVASAIQFLMGTISCGLIFLLGRRVFSRWTGFLAGLGGAVYGVAFFHEGTLLSVALIHTLNLLILLSAYWAADRARWTSWLVPGVLLGLSIITRPNIGLMLFVLGAWVWMQWAPSRRDLRTKAMPLLALALGVGAMLLPIAVRNMIVLREPIITVATGGLNFYLGNSRQSTGFLIPFGNLGLSAHTIVNDFRQVAEKRLGRPVSYRESSRYWFKRTWTEIKQDPDHWRQLLLNKFLLFLNGYEITTSINYYSIREIVPFLRLPWLSFGIVCPLALVGLVLYRRRWRVLFPLLGVIAVYLFSNVALFVSSEYRYAVVPVFLIFGSAATLEMVQRIRARAWSSLYLPGALLLFFGLMANLNLLSADARNYRQATAHYNFGGLLMRLEQYEQASVENSQAREFMPDNFKLALAQSDAFYKSGQYKKALIAADEAFRLDPENPDSMTSYANALTAMGKYDRAIEIRKDVIRRDPDNPVFLFNLGVSLLWSGRDQEAEAAFHRAIQIDPMYLAESDRMKQRVLRQRGQPASGPASATVRVDALSNTPLPMGKPGQPEPNPRQPNQQPLQYQQQYQHQQQQYQQYQQQQQQQQYQQQQQQYQPPPVQYQPPPIQYNR